MAGAAVGRYVDQTGMGLFVSVVHIKDVVPAALRAALDLELSQHGFSPIRTERLPQAGPDAMSDFDSLTSKYPSYLVSTRPSSWLTLIEASFAVDGTPWISELSAALAARLDCYTLCLMVHDDDVFFYNLEHAGTPLDGYNSCPQYLEQVRLPEDEVESQRHAPEAFGFLLRDEPSLRSIRDLLNRGWWNAHDTGQLDLDGVPLRDEDTFPFDSEAERMAALADMLDIPGGEAPYPYACWRTSPEIAWSSFELLVYAPDAG